MTLNKPSYRHFKLNCIRKHSQSAFTQLRLWSPITVPYQFNFEFGSCPAEQCLPNLICPSLWHANRKSNLIFHHSDSNRHTHKHITTRGFVTDHYVRSYYYCYDQAERLTADKPFELDFLSNRGLYRCPKTHTHIHRHTRTHTLAYWRTKSTISA